MSFLHLLFGLERPVNRKTYFTIGVGLMILKLGVDLSVLYAATGRLWRPWDYISFVPLTGSVPDWAIWALVLWAIPFAWIGLSMSVRRSVDAGISPWLGLIFCIPVVNLALMLMLSLLPSQESSPNLPTETLSKQKRTHSQLRAIAAALLVAVTMALVGIMLLDTLGVVLFAGTPFGMGVIAAYLYNQHALQTVRGTLSLATASLLTAFGVLLLFAVEGVLCLAMALPLAVPMALVGAVLGRSIAYHQKLPPTTFTTALPMVMFALLFAAWAEPELTPKPSQVLHQITSEVEIDAPPEVVWHHVIELSELPPPNELWFRLGIAYPTRARLYGRGVGAVRHCEFSTGAFVEPITVWDAPHHLAFDVADQPAPLRELSPYPIVHADHRDHSILSRRGEFRLRPGDDDQTTVLQGTTWYELHLYPEPYWALWSDVLISSIHQRVLRHIRSEAEADETRKNPAAS